MASELKAHLTDWKKTAAGLYDRGATLQAELSLTDTYYLQPQGFVLKITQTKAGATLVKLKAEGKGFTTLSSERIDAEKLEAKKQGLAKEFGVRAELKKRRLVFGYQHYAVLLELIEGLGEFMIVQGETVPPSIFEELGVDNPQFVTVSFDELKIRKDGQTKN